jgi:hypothetical protein
MGRVFFVLHPQTLHDRIFRSESVSGPFLMTDKRFHVLPKNQGDSP